MAITAVGESQSFAYTGGVQEFVVPVSGIYKLEVYGARGQTLGPGAETSVVGSGGLGGYSCGYKLLKKGDAIYVCVGGSGVNNAGGYNGGGRSATGAGVNWAGNGGAGGGATHIAVTSGTLVEIGEANLDKILIVAGGGGGGYFIDSQWGHHGVGGSGGGLTGGIGNSTYWAGTTAGATQTTGYAFGQGQHEAGYNGASNAGRAGAGGGGLYGGYSTGHTAGSGGSGYIEGVPEFTHKGVTYAPTTVNGVQSGHGTAVVTLVAKASMLSAYIGDESIVAAYIGDTEITSVDELMYYLGLGPEPEKPPKEIVALIPAMTSNTTPYNTVSMPNGNTSAYKPFGNMPAAASTGYAMSGFNVEQSYAEAFSFTYEFDELVDITKIELIPYYYRVLNYVVWHGVTYTVTFIHEDDTETVADTFTTTAVGYASGSGTPADAYSLHEVDISADNKNVKAIKIDVSGPIFTYDGRTYGHALNYFQAYGSTVD